MTSFKASCSSSWRASLTPRRAFSCNHSTIADWVGLVSSVSIDWKRTISVLGVVCSVYTTTAPGFTLHWPSGIMKSRATILIGFLASTCVLYTLSFPRMQESRDHQLRRHADRALDWSMLGIITREFPHLLGDSSWGKRLPCSFRRTVIDLIPLGLVALEVFGCENPCSRFLAI